VGESFIAVSSATASKSWRGSYQGVRRRRLLWSRASVPRGWVQRLSMGRDRRFDVPGESPSMVAVEPAGIRAMRSEILRRTGSDGRITATGCASRSAMTSPQSQPV
jgi:hypothetical protein